MKYKLWFRNGHTARTAPSMDEAIRIARQVLGASRVYRGVQYVTDEPSGDDRRTVEALDIWRSRIDASSQRSVSADCVITW